MGFGSALFGSSGGYSQFYNPYIEQLANAPMADFRGPRQYYKSILGGAKKGDFSNIPGAAQFDQAVARSNREIDEQASPLGYTNLGAAGSPLIDRIKSLNKERASEGINSQRFGFVQNALDNAAGGLFNIANAKNQFNLQRLQGAAGLYNGTFNYRPPSQGLFGGIVGALGQAYGAHEAAGAGGTP